MNTGYVKYSTVFNGYWNDTITTTFILTEEYTFSILGAYEIPDSAKGYIFVFNNDRRTACFTWDGDTTLHKILK
jgi:hypothetical protein